jgi:prefoldin subunit 5
MESPDWGKIFQTGYYVTLGATTTLIEVLQDAQKRDQLWRSLQQNTTTTLQDLAEKGVATEAEARSYVDRTVTRTPSTVNTTATTVPETSSDVQSELEDLTQQLAALRQELEQLQR